jgi:hypothetical protein
VTRDFTGYRAWARTGPQQIRSECPYLAGSFFRGRLWDPAAHSDDDLSAHPLCIVVADRLGESSTKITLVQLGKLTRDSHLSVLAAHRHEILQQPYKPGGRFVQNCRVLQDGYLGQSRRGGGGRARPPGAKLKKE